MAHMIVMIGANGKVIYWDITAEQFFGYQRLMLTQVRGLPEASCLCVRHSHSVQPCFGRSMKFHSGGSTVDERHSLHGASAAISPMLCSR